MATLIVNLERFGFIYHSLGNRNGLSARMTENPGVLLGLQFVAHIYLNTAGRNCKGSGVYNILAWKSAHDLGW
jgi:hypothetical protein